MWPGRRAQLPHVFAFPAGCPEPARGAGSTSLTMWPGRCAQLLHYMRCLSSPEPAHGAGSASLSMWPAPRFYAPALCIPRTLAVRPRRVRMHRLKVPRLTHILLTSACMSRCPRLQCDQDAYACTGQKCSAQSILFMHDNWAEAGRWRSVKAWWAWRRPWRSVTTCLWAQFSNPLLSDPSACRPGEGAGAAGSQPQAGQPDGGAGAERDDRDDAEAHRAPAADTGCAELAAAVVLSGERVLVGRVRGTMPTHMERLLQIDTVWAEGLGTTSHRAGWTGRGRHTAAALAINTVRLAQCAAAPCG